VVCYFEDGVAALYPTGLTLPVFERAYVTKNRGLLAKGSVIPVAEGVHFGIFTDGFWFFTEQGEWQEAGVAEVNGARVRKFTDYFFHLLDKAQTGAIQMGYDPERRLVYISFPISGTGGFSTNVWVYELGADRMWIQNYSTSTGNDADWVSSWGYLRAVEAPATNRFSLVHGSPFGMVWEHVPDTWQRNGVAPTWDYSTATSDFGDPYSLKTWLTNRVDFHGHAATGNLTTAMVDGRDGASLGSATTAYAASTSRRTLMVPANAGTSTTAKITLSGSHPFTLFGMHHEFVKTGDAL
jgi:hypothetical protein